MELLPCPFCGGKASFDHDDNGWNWIVDNGWNWVVCGKCGVTTDCRTHTMEDCHPLLAEQWNRRASPASAPEGFKHDIGADRFTVVQGSYWWHVRAGEGTQNIGKFHTKRAAEEMALTLLTAFRDGAFMQYQAMLAAAPTPPVSEDRKDADRFREGWTHACNALCMEIALWIERCPHCGMPAPKAPAMQEDKQ